MSKGQPQQQGQGSGDSGLAPVWITLLLMITAYFIWMLGHTYIVAFVFKLNLWQGKAVLWFFDDPALRSDVRVMETIDPAAVTWSQFMDITDDIGSYIRYPVIVVLAIAAVYMYFSNIKLRFRKTHDMKSLRQQEQYNWLSIMPVVKEDLVEADIAIGPWAMALSPMEFAKKYQLLRKDDVLMDDPMPGMDKTAGIRKADAKRVFTLQLGPYFEGFERVKPHVQALAAVFMARVNRDRKSADQIIEVLNKTWSTGKPDYSLVRPVLQKYFRTEIVQETLQKHAYLLTAMASLLEVARQDGVVPTSDFLWLKPTDRRLWYMLNCVGRQTPFSEVAGPFAHWKAEKALGRRSLVPMIDEAIKALELAVKEVKLPQKELDALEP